MATTVKQRPYCDMRASMATNCLLQRTKMGKVTNCTYKLPEEDFAYGAMKHDDHGVNEIFHLWNVHEPKKKNCGYKSPRRRQDMVATNRQAIKAGCISAREFRDFKLEHEILVKKQEDRANYDDIEWNIKKSTMTFGMPTPPCTEMKGCLTYQYCREAKERAKASQTFRANSVSIKSPRPSLSRGLRPTRASRGHTVRMPSAPTHADTFKMKRFLAIDHYAIDDKWE